MFLFTALFVTEGDNFSCQLVDPTHHNTYLATILDIFRFYCCSLDYKCNQVVNES